MQIDHNGAYAVLKNKFNEHDQSLIKNLAEATIVVRPLPWDLRML